MDLNGEVGKIEKSFQIEVLNEELHKLKFRLNVRQHLETDYEEDLKKLEEKIFQNEKNQADQIENLKKKLLETKSKNVVLETNCSTLVEQNEFLKQELKEKGQLLAEFSKRSTNNASENQLETAKTKIYKLESENSTMNEKMKLLQASLVKKIEENQILEQNLLDSNEKSRELELLLADRRQIFSEIETELSEARIELQTLKMSLTVDENHAGKGNSLFSEVNDHRLKVENYASSLKQRNDLLNEEIKLLKKEKYNLKTQIAKMFRISSSNEGVSNEICLLEEALASKKAELNSMQTKFDELRSSFGKFSKQNGPKFTPLDELLQFYKSQNDSLSLENEKQRMLKMLSDDKALEIQRNLCKISAENDRLRAELIFMQTNFTNSDEKTTSNKNESTLKLTSSSNVLRTKNFDKLSVISSSKIGSIPNDVSSTNVNDSKTTWHSANDETIKILNVLTMSSSIAGNKENKFDEQVDGTKNKAFTRPKGRKIISNVVKITDDVVVD